MMRSLSTRAFGQPSETKPTLGGFWAALRRAGSAARGFVSGFGAIVNRGRNQGSPLLAQAEGSAHLPRAPVAISAQVPIIPSPRVTARRASGARVRWRWRAAPED